MAHTPGPWEWYFKLGKNLETDCGVFHDDNGKAYSVCRCPRYQGQRQWEDDARLIAAAPDLLRACIAAVEWYGLDGDGISDPTRTIINDAINKAIKKGAK